MWFFLSLEFHKFNISLIYLITWTLLASVHTAQESNDLASVHLPINDEEASLHFSRHRHCIFLPTFKRFDSRVSIICIHYRSLICTYLFAWLPSEGPFVFPSYSNGSPCLSFSIFFLLKWQRGFMKLEHPQHSNDIASLLLSQPPTMPSTRAHEGERPETCSQLDWL